MSGGHWNYRDQKFVYDSEELVALCLKQQLFSALPKILEAIRKCFHEIDWAESADSSRKDAEPRIYDVLLALCDELFGG